ncbi:hypothetical protein I6E49_06205 [Prevotella stercorea]|uniref:hypothetical protein n=1 Tax=Leyella stercorea TaxID=363265 RepID=UPI001F1A651D|nr:hypothetical protein [Leyella stercorea]MCF2644895.1 hypothetical protein [Leyella stercorea]
MKKLSSFFLMGTVALAGLGVMSSCSSDDLGNDSTTNPGETKAVKTQFALNIPRANGGTRMSGDNAQATQNFLGMEDIRMYSFKGEPTASSTSTATFTLANIAPGISETASSKIYSDVSVPVGTTHFLFYAHAPQGTTDVTNADNFTKGVLNFAAGTDNATATNDISAALVGVKGTDNGSADKLLAVLNAVAGVENWSTVAETTELGKLYKNFITLKAGSANSIRLALQDLYNALGGVTTGSDADAKTIANNIRTAIKTDNVFTVTEQTNKTFAITTANTYPNNINLPDGAVQLSYAKETKTFSYAGKSDLTGIQQLDAAKICFPASIYYFQSSDLAATAAELDNTAWPKTTSDWTSNTVAPWLKDGAAGWTASVQPTTRSIAMRQNINYGVANLATTVKCGAETLADNVGLKVSEPNEFTGTVTVPTEGFTVTGLLIGGQPTKVGFNFQPSDDKFDYTIYDKNLTGIVAKNAESTTTNYTIVLPNDKGRGVAKQEKVNVAIELTNNSGVAFRGADGIIPDGGKFYLVGQLNPDAKTIEGVANPAVFMSDYMTTMNLTITSLKSAYNTIPDLRSTKLQLGLSVDLDWQAGLQFDVNID